MSSGLGDGESATQNHSAGGDSNEARKKSYQALGFGIPKILEGSLSSRCRGKEEDLEVVW